MQPFNFQFNAREHDPTVGFPVLPPGDYVFMIRKSNIKGTQAQNGGMLALEYEVVSDGPMKGRKTFNNLNLWNPSQQAVEIAQRELSAICHATGVLDVTASAQPDMAIGMLHNIPFMARATVSVQKETGRENNNFSNYRTAQGAALVRGQPGGVGGPQPGGMPPGAQPMQGAPAGFGQPPAGPPAGFGAAPGAPAPGPQGWGPQPGPQPGFGSPQPGPAQFQPQAGAQPQQGWGPQPGGPVPAQQPQFQPGPAAPPAGAPAGWGPQPGAAPQQPPQQQSGGWSPQPGNAQQPWGPQG